MSGKTTFVFKIVLIGDFGVGKTSLIRRYVDRHFKESYILTIGADYSIKQIEVGDLVLNLTLWDMAGQERLKLPKTTLFRGASAAIVVFDLANANTFNLSVTAWLDELYQTTGRIPIVLAGNKSDLEDDRKVSEADAISVANKLSCPYVETSAKTGKNVDMLFQELISQILKSKGIDYKISVGEIGFHPPTEIEPIIKQNRWGVEQEQARILEELEKLIQQKIPVVTKLSSEPFGVIIDGDQVKGLGLFRCGLKTIPDILTKLSSLEELRIYDNLISSIPEFVFTIKNLKILGLTKNNLENLPSSIGKLESLEYLSVRGNRLSNLPDSLNRLKKLDYLNLNGNHFILLPEVVCQLKSLKQLDLAENRLEELPDCFGDLITLEELDCSNNKLEQLPESFGNLRFLINLNLYFNKIKKLPESFHKLNSLEILNLSYNQLPNLPDSIMNLEKIQFLGLTSNRLTGLPMKLWHLKSLNEIHLDGNPWEGEWTQVVKNNIAEIFDYCRRHDAITVFCSHAEKDFESNLINILDTSKFLSEQEEIYKVYYSEEAIQGGMNFIEFMRKYVPLSHILLFFATENSLQSDPCKFELQLALDNQIPIIPILGPNLTWESLNQISLINSTGEPFQLGEIKGIPYLNDISIFGEDLYNHIYELKREINLFDKEEMQIDKFKLEFAELFNDFLKSNEFHNLLKNRFEEVKRSLSEYKNQTISFSYLAKTIFETLV
ncbi:MAG: GTP-binding protein [Promethearchaeota archaeon]